ncbi:MAG: hypothetical protein NC311_09690 [Muribaculaceae bacterium]|nr:hypothetical protein [Muribaculaceae bacterium]
MRWVLALCAALALSGCTRTVYTPIETVRTEREETVRWRTDTVIDRDTVSILQRGDTVLLESTKWRWRVKEIYDTVIIERTDSVAVPYPVEKKLTRWQQTKMDYGGIALGATIIALCVAVAWLAKKFRR